MSQEVLKDEKILVVDDDVSYCRNIQVLLASEGLKSFVVHSVADARDALSQQNYPLILLDIKMPGTSGPELLNHINDQQLGTSVIVVSGETEINTAVQVIKLGAQDYISKPYDPEEFLITVKNTLHIRKLELENRYLADELEKSENHRHLLQKVESIGRLAGGISHDFNNMISAILGYSELALRKVEEGSSIQKNLLQIKEAALRSASLTSQLLGFARKQPISPQVLDLSSAVEEALHILKRLLSEDIELHWNPKAKQAHILMDPAQLSQILTNLVINSNDALDKVGAIEISTDRVLLDDDYCRKFPWCIPGEYVSLSVSDDGMGMSDEIKNHIFEPFYTTKDCARGTGLGLATVYGIVKQNNAFIDVFSEPGLGTSFKIYFPEERETILAPEPASIPNPGGGHETILLVEDEVLILEPAKIFLEEAGYRVIATTNAEEAPALAMKEDIDLLLTDVIMPKINGKELAHKLVAIKPEMKVLYMSGYEASILTPRGQLEPDVELLIKPIKSDLLIHKVREVLDTR